MPRKPKLDARGLRERRDWPTLPEAMQQELAHFLGWYRAIAEQGYAKAAELAAMATVDNGTRETAAYWGHVVRAIDWLMSYIPHKQQYLEILQAEKEGRWKPQEPGPGT